MSYDLVDVRSKLPFPVEDLNSEDAVSNVSSFDSISQDYSSATQGSTLNSTQAYSLSPPRRSSHQLRESQNAEPRAPDLSHRETRNRKSAAKTVASFQTRARWAMLRSLVGAAGAEEEAEMHGDSGDRDNGIERHLQAGEAEYQASENNLAREDSDLYRPQDPGIAVVPSDLSVASDMLATSRDLLSNSSRSATEEKAAIERYLHDLSKDPQIDIRGLSASLPRGRMDTVEKDFKALAAPVEHVLRADAQGLERIVHPGKERVENAVEQASVRGAERALYAGGKRIENAVDSLGKTGEETLEKDAHEIKREFEKGEGMIEAHGLERALYMGGKRIENAAESLGDRGGKALEEDAREIKKAFEKEEGSIGAGGLERTLHTGAERIENAVGSFGKRAGNGLKERAHKIERAVEREEGLSTGAHKTERAVHVGDERIKNGARSLENRARRTLEEDAHETKKVFEKGEGLFTGAHGLERAFHVEEERIKNDAGFLGNKAEEVFEKDAHETRRMFKKGEGLLKDPHELERAVLRKNQELNHNIGHLGSETGKALSREGHEIKQGLEKGEEGLITGVHGLERAIHTKGQELGDDIGDLGRDTGKVLRKEAHEIEQFLGKGEAGLKQAVHTTGHEVSKDLGGFGRDSGDFLGKEAHVIKQSLGREEVGLKQAIHTKGREIRNDIGDAGRNTGEVLGKEAHEIKNGLDGAVNSVMGTHMPLPTSSRGPRYAPQPLRTTSPSTVSKINAPQEQKQTDVQNSYWLPSGAERSRPPKQNSLVNGPRPRTGSTEPQAFTQPQRHENLPSSTQSSLVSPKARRGRPVSPALRGMQQQPISYPPTDEPRNQQANNEHIPPPQSSQKPSIPLQEEHVSRSSNNGVNSRPANINQDSQARPRLPSQGPAPRAQQMPSSIPAPSGRTIVEPTNVDPSLHRPVSLVPGFPDSHLMPTEQPTGRFCPSISPATNQDTRESSRLQFHNLEESSINQYSQHSLRRHQSPSNASLKTSASSAPSISTESTIPKQPTTSTEPPSTKTTPPHPLAIAFEHAITGFKRRSEAGNAARCNNNPGFHDMMMGLLVKVGEDALPVLQQRLEENQRRG